MQICYYATNKYQGRFCLGSIELGRLSGQLNNCRLNPVSHTYIPSGEICISVQGQSFGIPAFASVYNHPPGRINHWKMPYISMVKPIPFR